MLKLKKLLYELGPFGERGLCILFKLIVDKDRRALIPSIN